MIQQLDQSLAHILSIQWIIFSWELPFRELFIDEAFKGIRLRLMDFEGF
jgi:hypothetical protein